MPVISENVSGDQLEERRATILSALGTTWDELAARRASGLLTAEEWEAWEELDGINYLLAE